MNDYHIRICQRLPNSGAKPEAVVELGRQRRQVLAELALLFWPPGWAAFNPLNAQNDSVEIAVRRSMTPVLVKTIVVPLRVHA
ncbi:hypothetical protein AU476_37810 [Cupriavidus sp. UYMSc13B]|nr:hypothetical protein AU476_37810 [Cupriavidus sp. UYMSc13B]